MESIIITILWSICSLLLIVQYAPICNKEVMSKFDILIAGTIFIIGGPFFAIVNILEALLDCVMPEGWDNGNETKM